MTPTLLTVILSFTSVALFSVNYIVNKLMLTKLIPHPVSYLILITACNLIFLLPALYFFTPTHSFPGTPIALVLGFIVGLSTYFQNRLFQLHSAEVVSILSRTIPVFTAILSAIFLFERLGSTQYAGVMLLISSSLLVSIIPKHFKKHLSIQTILFATGYNLLIASVTVARKATLESLDYWSFFYFSQLGTFLVSPLLLSFPKLRKQFIFDIKTFTATGYVLRIITYFTFLAGTGLQLYALQIGSATIVSGVTAIQPLIILFYGYLAYKLFTFIQINQVEIPLTKKLLALITALAGSLLLILT